MIVAAVQESVMNSTGRNDEPVQDATGEFAAPSPRFGARFGLDEVCAAQIEGTFFVTTVINGQSGFTKPENIMKVTKSICFSLLIAMGAAAVVSGAPFRTDINPAMQYYQAFNVAPDWPA